MQLKNLMLAAGLLLGSVTVAAAGPALVTADLNLRSGPGVNYGVVGMLPGGSTVNVVGCRGSWCRVAGGGYASRSYLDNRGGPVYAAEPVYVGPPVYGPPVYVGPPAIGFGFGFGGGWGGHHGWRGGHHYRH